MKLPDDVFASMTDEERVDYAILSLSGFPQGDIIIMSSHAYSELVNYHDKMIAKYSACPVCLARGYHKLSCQNNSNAVQKFNIDVL